MTFKNTARFLHLWLGLLYGLLVIIIALTGCIYTFQQEIQDLVQDYRFVQPQEKAFLPPSEILAVSTPLLPEKHVHAVQYRSADRAAETIFYSFDPAYYYIIYSNPYTGEVLKVKDMDADFFRFILMGHFYLWLPPAIGQPVVATATLVFIFMLISGIVLWWPKNKKTLSQRLTLKQKAGWKRRNFDLHNVLGFYASAVVLVLCLTGLVWGFEWFRDAAYFVAGGQKSPEWQEPASGPALTGENPVPATDMVWQFMKAAYPDAASIEVHIPENETSCIEANANLQAGTIWKTDFRYFDQYTLAELPINTIYGRIEDADAADKLLRMNYDIHTGAILGLPGKILAFAASLIFASLPVTGFLIWLGRRKKIKTRPKKEASKKSGIKKHKQTDGRLRQSEPA